GVADVQPVAAGLGAVAGLPIGTRTAVGAQPVTEAGLLPPEFAVAGRVIPLVLPFTVDQQSHESLLLCAAFDACRQPNDWAGTRRRHGRDRGFRRLEMNEPAQGGLVGRRLQIDDYRMYLLRSGSFTSSPRFAST